MDIALDVGGLPRGRIAEIYGPPASGKTTLVQHIVTEAQKRGNNVIFIDMEHCLDPRYAERCGIMLKDVLLAQPKTGEEALQIAKRSLNSGDIDLVILDSIAALVTRAEIKAPSLRPAAGEINRLLPLAFREISLACIRNNASLICTNQLRKRLKTGYGPSETTPGG